MRNTTASGRSSLCCEIPPASLYKGGSYMPKLMILYGLPAGAAILICEEG